MYLSTARALWRPLKAAIKNVFGTQLSTNHVAHFLLFQLLKPLLLEPSTHAFQSRVVAVASTGHRGGGVQFND